MYYFICVQRPSKKYMPDVIYDDCLSVCINNFRCNVNIGLWNQTLRACFNRDHNLRGCNLPPSFFNRFALIAFHSQRLSLFCAWHGASSSFGLQVGKTRKHLSALIVEKNYSCWWNMSRNTQLNFTNQKICQETKLSIETSWVRNSDVSILT